MQRQTESEEQDSSTQHRLYASAKVGRFLTGRRRTGDAHQANMSVKNKVAFVVLRSAVNNSRKDLCPLVSRVELLVLI